MANETVLFKRGDSATITSTPVTDGQILFDTSGNGKMYLDNGTDRLEMGGAITVDASLSKTSTNAIQNKAVTGNILNSLAEVSAATQQNTIAGALALKEVNNSLAGLFSDCETLAENITIIRIGNLRVISCNNVIYDNLNKLPLNNEDFPVVSARAVGIRTVNNAYITFCTVCLDTDGIFTFKKYDGYNSTSGASNLSNNDALQFTLIYSAAK